MVQVLAPDGDFSDVGDGKACDDAIRRAVHDALAHLTDDPSEAADTDSGDGAADDDRA